MYAAHKPFNSTRELGFFSFDLELKRTFGWWYNI